MVGMGVSEQAKMNLRVKPKGAQKWRLSRGGGAGPYDEFKTQHTVMNEAKHDITVCTGAALLLLSFV